MLWAVSSSFNCRLLCHIDQKINTLVGLSFSLTAMITAIVKVTVGRPRPGMFADYFKLEGQIRD